MKYKLAYFKTDYETKHIKYKLAYNNLKAMQNRTGYYGIIDIINNKNL